MATQKCWILWMVHAELAKISMQRKRRTMYLCIRALIHLYFPAKMSAIISWQSWQLTVNHYKKHNNTEVIKYPFYEIFFLNSPEKKLKLFFKWVCYPYLAQKFRSLLLLCSQDVEHSGVSRKGGMTIFVFLSLN